ncbi:MazE Growth regulator [Burkholderiales bacterium]
MKVVRWGNSLAIRLPAKVVEVLELKEGDDIQIHVFGSRAFAVQRRPNIAMRLDALRNRGALMPKDYVFNREVVDGLGRDR